MWIIAVFLPVLLLSSLYLYELASAIRPRISSCHTPIACQYQPIILLLTKTEQRRAGHNRYEVVPHLHLVCLKTLPDNILHAYYRITGTRP